MRLFDALPCGVMESDFRCQKVDKNGLIEYPHRQTSEEEASRCRRLYQCGVWPKEAPERTTTLALVLDMGPDRIAQAPQSGSDWSVLRP